MNLQKVDLGEIVGEVGKENRRYSRGFACVCLLCGKTIQPNETRYADLDGEAFKAYYCEPHANMILNGEIITEQIIKILS